MPSFQISFAKSLPKHWMVTMESDNVPLLTLEPSDDQPEFKCLHSVWQRQRQSDDDDGIVRACSLTSAPTIYVFSPTGHPCKERLILTARTCKKYTMKKSPSNPCRRIYITPFNFFFLEHMKWVGSSKLVSFPQEIFFLQKNNFSAFLQVDIYSHRAAP